MQKRAVIALFCRNPPNFDSNERGEFRSYQDAWGTEFAQFFPEIQKKLSIFRFDDFKGQISILGYVLIFEKIIFAVYGPYWGNTANIPKTIFKAFPPAELLKTARVNPCATPSQRV